MSMRQWVGYAVMGIGMAFARHGHACYGWLAMGAGVRGGMGRP